MKKLAITMIGFAVVGTGLMGWMVYTVTHEVPVQVTVIKLADIKTDSSTVFAYQPNIGPQHVTMKPDEAQGVKAAAEYAARW